MASAPVAAATENVENGSVTAPGSDATVDTSKAAAAETTTASAGTGVVKTDGEEAAATATPAASEAAKQETAAPAEAAVAAEKKWPGWPGHCVYRLVVPVLKVGSIIGRKGELIKKMCEETRAKIRVLDGPVGNPDRIVLISGKEEPEAPLSPAMEAVIRVFKRVSGLPEGTGDSDAAAAAFCSIRLLVASTQAINLIGRQGSSIKSIQEGSGATIRVLSNDDGPSYATPDERIVEVQGETNKVLKALEAVVGHLRKFLVDQSVLPLFEKTPIATPTQERQADPWADQPLHHGAPQPGLGSDYPLSSKRDTMYFERESLMEQHIPSSGISMYGQDPGLPGARSSGIGRAGGPIVTQMSQTMQIPLAYAEDIIGVGGANIAYIRRTSGAILTVQESRGLPDEITVEIKGSSSQVQTAQQLIQEFISSHKEPASSGYGKMDSGYRSSYSQMGDNPYSSSSLSGPPYGGGGYGSSGVGGYSSYRL